MTTSWKETSHRDIFKEHTSTSSTFILHPQYNTNLFKPDELYTRSISGEHYIIKRLVVDSITDDERVDVSNSIYCSWMDASQNDLDIYNILFNAYHLNIVNGFNNSKELKAERIYLPTDQLHFLNGYKIAVLHDIHVGDTISTKNTLVPIKPNAIKSLGTITSNMNIIGSTSHPTDNNINFLYQTNKNTQQDVSLALQNIFIQSNQNYDASLNNQIHELNQAKNVVQAIDNSQNIQIQDISNQSNEVVQTNHSQDSLINIYLDGNIRDASFEYIPTQSIYPTSQSTLLQPIKVNMHVQTSYMIDPSFIRQTNPYFPNPIEYPLVKTGKSSLSSSFISLNSISTSPSIPCILPLLTDEFQADPSNVIYTKTIDLNYTTQNTQSQSNQDVIQNKSIRQWMSLSSGINPYFPANTSYCSVIEIHPEPSKQNIVIIGGHFQQVSNEYTDDSIDTITTNNIALWNHSRWYSLEEAYITNPIDLPTHIGLSDINFNPTNVNCNCIVIHSYLDTETNQMYENIYVGGDFIYAGDTRVNNIARWNTKTKQWYSLGYGLSSYCLTMALDLSACNSPSSPIGILYVGGHFEYTLNSGYTNDLSVNYIASYNPHTNQWAKLHQGLDGDCYTLTFARDPLYKFVSQTDSHSRTASPWLYVGGSFMRYNDDPNPDTYNSRGITRWNTNTSQWDVEGIGYGLLYGGGACYSITAIRQPVSLSYPAYDEIYFTGEFTHSEVEIFHNIIRWNEIDFKYFMKLGFGLRSPELLSSVGYKVLYTLRNQNSSPIPAPILPDNQIKPSSASSVPLSTTTTNMVPVVYVVGDFQQVYQTLDISYQVNYFAEWNVATGTWSSNTHGFDDRCFTITCNTNDELFIGGRFHKFAPSSQTSAPSIITSRLNVDLSFNHIAKYQRTNEIVLVGNMTENNQSIQSRNLQSRLKLKWEPTTSRWMIMTDPQWIETTTTSISTTATLSSIYTTNKISIHQPTQASYQCDVSGNGIIRSNTFIQTSDKRLKTNIQSIPQSDIDSLSLLRGVYYSPLSNETKREIGFIAQEVEPIYPQLVSMDSSSSIKSLKYQNICGLLVEGIRELNDITNKIKIIQQNMNE
jgi:hypothetical protein